MACVALCSLNALADNKTTLNVKDLPQAAQATLNQHFKQSSIKEVYKKTEHRACEYTVRFANGTKVEFDAKGNWKEVETDGPAVPESLVPTTIKNYVNTYYKNQKITELERKRGGWEVELSKGTEILFDSKFSVLKVDGKVVNTDVKRDVKREHKPKGTKPATKPDKKK